MLFIGKPKGRSMMISNLACVYIYILYVCVYICVCVYVCGHVYMYIYACVYVFVHLCIYARVYVYVYACLCIDCGSWYQCFSVWTVSCMRMFFRCICMRMHMCVGIYICAFFCSECYMHFTGVLGTSAWAGVYVTQVCFYLQVFWALVHGQVYMLHRCVFTPT